MWLSWIEYLRFRVNRNRLQSCKASLTQLKSASLTQQVCKSDRRRLVTEQVLGLSSPVSRRGKLPSLQLICAVPCCRHRVPLHIGLIPVLRRALPTFKPTRAATLPQHSAALCPSSSRNPTVLTLTPCALRELMLTRVTPLHRSRRFGTPQKPLIVLSASRASVSKVPRHVTWPLTTATSLAASS